MAASDAIEATCNGRTGHIHRACAPKRKLLEDAKERSLRKRSDDEDHDGDDGYNDSQDSLESNSSGCSSSTGAFTMVPAASSSNIKSAKYGKAK